MTESSADRLGAGGTLMAPLECSHGAATYMSRGVAGCVPRPFPYRALMVKPQEQLCLFKANAVRCMTRDVVPESAVALVR
jgi:hypothetical protein